MNFRRVLLFAAQLFLAFPLVSAAGAVESVPLPVRLDSARTSMTSDVCSGASFCLVRGGSAKSRWYYPGCTNGCGTETWYVKDLPATVATASFSPAVTTGSQVTTMTIKVSPTAPSGDYSFEIGANCSGPTHCLGASLVLRVVKPTVTIVSQSVEADRISLQLDPPAVSGELVVELSGKPNNHVVKRVAKQAGGAVDVPYGAVAGTIAKSRYSKLTVTWTVAEAKAQAVTAVAFDVLGVYEQTQYHIVKESLCSGAKEPVTTWKLVPKKGGGTECSSSQKTYKTDFRSEVRENGSGLTEAGETTQIEGLCAKGPKHFRQPAQAQTAKCQGGTLGSNTVAVFFGSGLRCGDRLLIVGLPGAVGAVGAVKTVTDECPGCDKFPKGRDGHLDNFTEDGRCKGVVGLGHKLTIRLRS